MKKNILAILLVLSILVISLLVGCTTENATDNHLAEISEILKSTNSSNGAIFTLDIKSNGNTVSQENTTYSVNGGEVNYTTTVSKPNPDLFGDKLVTESGEGTITKAEYFTKLYYSLALSEQDLDGKIEVNVSDSITTYKFKLKNVGLFIDAEQSEVRDLIVSLKKSGNQLTEIELNYNYKGYIVNTKYTINY